jgi:hypothetical protein
MPKSRHRKKHKVKAKQRKNRILNEKERYEKAQRQMYEELLAEYEKKMKQEQEKEAVEEQQEEGSEGIDGPEI